MCGAQIEQDRIESLMFLDKLRASVLLELTSNPRFLLRRLLCHFAEAMEKKELKKRRVKPCL